MDPPNNLKVISEQKVRRFPVAFAGELNIVLRLHLSTIKRFGELFEAVHHKVNKPASSPVIYNSLQCCKRTLTPIWRVDKSEEKQADKPRLLRWHLTSSALSLNES